MVKRRMSEMGSKMLGRPVQIRLHSSIQHPGQEKEVHEVQVTGLYIEKPNAVYLKYDDKQNGEDIQTTVKMSTDDALIMRGGAVSMRLPFSLNVERLGEYRSGPAQFKLGVKTSLIEFTRQAGGLGGKFKVHYELVDEGTSVGTYELTMIYMEGT